MPRLSCSGLTIESVMPPERKERRQDPPELKLPTVETDVLTQELDTSTAILKKKKKPNSLMYVREGSQRE